MTKTYEQGVIDGIKKAAHHTERMGFLDPRINSAHDRQVVLWVASMLKYWNPPHLSLGVRTDQDGKKWADIRNEDFPNVGGV